MGLTMSYTRDPWEHPDWYDLHDSAYTAGSGRESEHYRELVMALPPLDRGDHVVDAGAGTGKLTLSIAQGYPRLGRITLIEPNRAKLERAEERVREAIPEATVGAVTVPLGEGEAAPVTGADLVVIGSVLMPTMVLRGGSLSEGLIWLHRFMEEVLTMVRPGGWIYDLETLAAPWERGGPTDPVRRLHARELDARLTEAGCEEVECMYRFRDRVVMRGRRPTR